VLSRLFEKRNVSYQSVWGSGGGWGDQTLAGTSVDQSTALRLGAVYACTRLLSDTLSTLPVDTFTRADDGNRIAYEKPVWVASPDGRTFADHIAQVVVSMLLDGNAFVRVVRKPNGEVLTLTCLPPQMVHPRQGATGVVFDVDMPTGKTTVAAADMLHITELKRAGELRGVSRISEAKQTLGLATALDEFAARFFGQGSNASGVIEYPESLTKEQAEDLVSAWELGHKGLKKSHRPGVLFGGAKFTKTSVDNDQSQFIQSRQFAVEEVARIFRVPPHMIGVTTPGAMSYASVEQNAIQFATYTLRPIIAKLEAAYSPLLLNPAAFIKWNLDGILRGDLATRYASYSTGMQAGFLSINDIHRLEDLAPVDGGEVYRVPLANVDLGAASVVETSKRVSMAVQLVNSGFDPQAVLTAMGLPAIDHTGLPTVQLQNTVGIDPDNPADAYSV
jgi:HK97 family phage portal protein